MQVAEAIEHLSADLRRYAQSGKASPKSITFRTLVLNTVIDHVNQLERESEEKIAALQSKVKALTADLEHRDQVIAQLHGAAFVDQNWSYLEGRAQTVLDHLDRAVESEEGKSMSPEQAKRQRKTLSVLRHELDTLYDTTVALQVAYGNTLMELTALRTWAAMVGVDMDQWARVPQEWHVHLEEALKVMRERMVVDGLITTQGMRVTGRQYRNPNAVAYNVLHAVWYEHQWRALCQQLGLAVDPDHEPLYLWDAAELRTTTPSMA